ncbi:hypothetical protein BST81_06580 [Leptolyngbya sp. 'hensonii']|uniref:hypothetical protein n=1 Tax=Leptolyngbya sp. 'hensonii' TaxID=1922337 RepID=UPI00094FF35B|nr:hypothetical protein [Leptolyngbya sp. 'hensonii']OLP19404.1 hypothetical protein BST81_06580 [Leptolyngbya sp. 'hensonii']
MKAQLIPVQALSAADRQAMYNLLQTHFDGVRWDVFEADLGCKNWAILLWDHDTLQGFSTLLIYETEFQGDWLTIVYSGDTIVDPGSWSSSVLSRSWLTAVRQLRQKYTRGKLYWLLISSGYRTYRFLPLFAQVFYPRYDRPTPPDIQMLMAFLARQQFGAGYDDRTGIVRFPHPQMLRAGLRDIPPERLKDPHIQFFQTRNPGHRQGDELVCLTEVGEANLTAAGQRLWSALALMSV